MSWSSPFPFREPESLESLVPPPTINPLSGRAIAFATSAATLPLLGGMVLSHWTMQALIELGSTSEELFRGDRLPLLKEL